MSLSPASKLSVDQQLRRLVFFLQQRTWLRRYAQYRSHSPSSIVSSLFSSTSAISSAANTNTVMESAADYSATEALEQEFLRLFEKGYILEGADSAGLASLLTGVFHSQTSQTDFQATVSGNTAAGVFGVGNNLYLKVHASDSEAKFEASIANLLFKHELYSDNAHKVIAFSAIFKGRRLWISLQERVKGDHVVNASSEVYDDYIRLALSIPTVVTGSVLREALPSFFSDGFPPRDFLSKGNECVETLTGKYSLNMKVRSDMWKSIGWLYNNSCVPMWDFWLFNAKVDNGRIRRYDYTKLHYDSETPGFELSQLIGARVCERRNVILGDESEEDILGYVDHLFSHGRSVCEQEVAKVPHIELLLGDFDSYVEKSLLWLCQRRLTYLARLEQDCLDQLEYYSYTLDDPDRNARIKAKVNESRRCQLNYERFLLIVGPKYFRSDVSRRFLSSMEKGIVGREYETSL